ncbi:MAG TPA: DUF2946 family protein [Parvibaculum sp.]
MRSIWERLGWTLATVSFALNVLLSVAHMGALGGHMMPMGHKAPTAIAAPAFSEAALLAALTAICTGDGIAERAAAGKDGKPALFPTCPICSLFATVTLVMGSGLLLLVLRRTEMAWAKPSATTRRLSEHLQSEARPRAPPSLWIAA